MLAGHGGHIALVVSSRMGDVPSNKDVVSIARRRDF